MKKQIVALTAIAALSTGAAASASAADYSVKKGDTLWSISQNNNVTVEQIQKWNNLSSTLIFPEQTLKVSGEEATSNDTYTVVKGDTLYKIATEHGITVGELMSWNGLSSDLIFPGQEFSVSGQAAAPAQAEAAPQSQPAQQEEPAEEEVAQDSGQTQSTEGVEGTGGEAPSSEAAQEMTVTATAYTAYCAGCSGVTATGIDLRSNPDQKVIAVDPNVIPLGSRVWVEGYGEAIAGDTGGAIKGNKIDLFIPSQQDALNYGVQTVDIKILD
ncbi:3D domain-containing protein [Jeotgalibacillus haloalkalitolerans]|uniref:LysM peptidoglycan-binding domain-containing protein n=1 Tax=Jeotgalibacillus haloalkalitolerans TaxID=3104292 RepID=A0ABU5KKP8_9BACL|nr:LysM peptidoglycan-binding domain-containing protein [Jeotgalibacillus sp. HH7-29]MDZ5711285.1 LysM peptidoglycan-binding domain-containing protein [Jeotgalibacillus sp. HH7-29]